MDTSVPYFYLNELQTIHFLKKKIIKCGCTEQLKYTDYFDFVFEMF